MSSANTGTGRPAPPQRDSLARHLMIVWLVTFITLIPVLAALVYIGWILMLLSMVGIPLEISTVATWILLTDVVLTSALTALYAIPAWIFRQPEKTEARPVRSWVETARQGADQPDDLDLPRRPLLTLVWPLYGLACLLISALASIVWLLDADLIYRYWRAARYLPYVAALSFLAGAFQLVWQRTHRPLRLARMGWRLRLVIAIAAAVMLPGVYEALAKTGGCSDHVLERLIEVQNLEGFQQHLDQNACRDDQLTQALSRLLRLDRESTIATAGDTRGGFLRELLDRHLEITRGAWYGLVSDEVLFATMLQYLTDGHADHPAFTAASLGQRLGDFAYEGDAATPQRFFAAGLRLDRADWPAYAPHLRHRTLDGDMPKWAVYDVMLAAGLAESPELATLIKAVRSGNATPLADWPRERWLALPDADDPGHSLLTWGILLADDEQQSRRFLGMAGISATDFLARTPLPTRCAFAKHLGADRVRASLNDADDPYQRAQCAEYMEAILRERAQDGRVR